MKTSTKAKLKKALAVGSISLVVLYWIIGFFIMLIPALMFLAYIYEVPEEERITEFADGSVCENTGGGTYDHRLFDGYYVYQNDNLFANRLSHTEKKLNIPEEYQKGLIYRYAFDSDGYIAYRYLEEWNKSGDPASYLYIWDDEYIIKDCSILYNCNTDEITVFDTFEKLRVYCDSNGINLGAWYNSCGYCCYQEEVHISKGNWTLTEIVFDYSVVCFGYEEFFAGIVDSYFETENGFGFHFQHIENNDANCHSNPVIPYSENETVGKKHSALLVFYDDVYADKYVYIDTTTNEYKIFDTKKEIKNYVKSLGTSPEWKDIMQ